MSSRRPTTRRSRACRVRPPATVRRRRGDCRGGNPAHPGDRHLARHGLEPAAGHRGRAAAGAQRLGRRIALAQPDRDAPEDARSATGPTPHAAQICGAHIVAVILNFTVTKSDVGGIAESDRLTAPLARRHSESPCTVADPAPHSPVTEIQGPGITLLAAVAAARAVLGVIIHLRCCMASLTCATTAIRFLKAV